MRTLAKSQIEKLKSVYMELDKEILCEIFSTIIYRLSQNGISVQIPILPQSKIDYLIENGLFELADATLKEPITEKIRIDCSKHDDDILLEFIHKVMRIKESEVKHEKLRKN